MTYGVRNKNHGILNNYICFSKQDALLLHFSFSLKLVANEVKARYLLSK